MGNKIIGRLRTSMGMVAVGLLVLSIGAFMVFPALDDFKNEWKFEKSKLKKEVEER